ncbi:NUDIX hydrolase [Paenibacillus sp. HW567]|uniref:NUDIX hydrolase n=1 Tax=Paenibacillus sp. HW567 TaxID=1034769 RepID=UPI00037EA29E|nr:NUDIX hydrolase [Paenibacillus sp. HW567]
MLSFNHFGVYGICQREGKLLVIRKRKGPYTGRYDLPGGRLEENEGLRDGLVREFMEETGLTVSVQSNSGTFDCFVRFQEEAFTHMHHIAALCTVEIAGEGRPAKIVEFAEQDSLGAEWVDLSEITLDSSSPVVVAAAEWLSNGILPTETRYYDDWETKNQPTP